MTFYHRPTSNCMTIDIVPLFCLRAIIDNLHSAALGIELGIYNQIRSAGLIALRLDTDDCFIPCAYSRKCK